MQPLFSCVPKTFQGVEDSLSPARLGRYFGDAGGNKHHALRLYVWNARLCEAFYLPIQMAEVAIRNGIHRALLGKHGANWFERGSFLCTLPMRLRCELKEVVRTEKSANGAMMTVDHLVSGLSFGFWLHLLTKNYEGVFWPIYFPKAFPNKPGHVNRQSLYDRIDNLRVFRNKIAHHKPIFDRAPKGEYQNVMELVSWVCQETHWFVRIISEVEQTINSRPAY